MTSAKRLALLALLASLTAALVLAPVTDVDSAEPPATLATPESFAGDRRRGGAVGGAVHGSRQGADLAALRELPSGRRPAAARRSAAGCISRRSIAAHDGFGTATMRCGTCHQGGNYDPAGMPGHPHWHLAPREMAWQGKTLGEICTQIKDPARNGGRSLDADS